jgi:hypothetical protein
LKWPLAPAFGIEMHARLDLGLLAALRGKARLDGPDDLSVRQRQCLDVERIQEIDIERGMCHAGTSNWRLSPGSVERLAGIRNMPRRRSLHLSHVVTLSSVAALRSAGRVGLDADREARHE